MTVATLIQAHDAAIEKGFDRDAEKFADLIGLFEKKEKALELEKSFLAANQGALCDAASFDRHAGWTYQNVLADMLECASGDFLNRAAELLHRLSNGDCSIEEATQFAINLIADMATKYGQLEASR